MWLDLQLAAVRFTLRTPAPVSGCDANHSETENHGRTIELLDAGINA